MTSQSDILQDSNFLPVLDKGFVGIIDTLGNDSAITQAARVSYGAGTKSVNEDRGLIRYLLRHQHTSPFEQCEVKLFIKLPIFVMRQLVRHRTANLNEYSGRYSIMSDEFYLPETAHIEPQSTTNKQGRAGTLDGTSKAGTQWLMQTAYEHSYAAYKALLGERDQDVVNHYDPYDKQSPLLTDEFPGIARELARVVLPVANYTECYWKTDLLNLFRMLKLRNDSHAQYEIREYARAITKLVEPLFPMAFEAFTDYMMEAVTLSRMEVELMRDIMLKYQMEFGKITDEHFAHHGLTKREARDFSERFAWESSAL